MKTYKEFGQLLRSMGVDVVFGLMGDANMHWLTAFQEARGRFVPAGHEASAVAMADAYSRMTGQLGVATVTHGPGFTNAITPLVEASRNGSSVLLVTGDPPAEPTHMQRLDIGAVCAALRVTHERVYGPESLTRDVNRSFRLVSASNSPVVLNVPLPILLADTATQTAAPMRPLAPSARSTDLNDLDDALGLIVSSRRPLILAGRGAVVSGAESEIMRLAEILGTPLATTAMAREMFRGHAANLGIFGSLSHHVASEAIAEADCIISFGASLNRYTTMAGELTRGKRIVQIDDDASALGSYVSPERGIVSDAKLAATAMIAVLSQAGHQGDEGWVRRIEKRLSSSDPFEFQDVSTDNTVDIRTAMRELDRCLPSTRSVVSDIGRFVHGTWPYVTVSDPGAFTAMSSFGSLGLGLAGAIGAAVARPESITVALLGDGGFMMYAAELATAVREGLRLVVIVFNDGAYGAEYYKLKALGIDIGYSLNNWPSLTETAAALGAQARRVTSAKQIEDLAPMFASATGPILIDVQISPEHNLVN